MKKLGADKEVLLALIGRYTRQEAAYKPAREADLDNYNQGPVLFEYGERAA
jgi:predicted transcriptional regulator